MPASAIAIRGPAPDRRFVVLLGVSAALHALALAWVKMPPQPLTAPTMLSVLSASLRVSVGAAHKEAQGMQAAVREQTPPAHTEARQSPARREPRALPAALETAGPTTVRAASAPAAVAESTAAPTAVAAMTTSAAPQVASEAPAAETTRQLDNYGQRLSEIFSRQQQYPRLAAMRGWEGEVRVRLSVARQGSLTAVRLERSSGYEVLDKHALAMIEEIGQLPPPPAGLAQSAGDVQVVVPVHYKLRKPA